jgi:hypothetical protein
MIQLYRQALGHLLWEQELRRQSYGDVDNQLTNVFSGLRRNCDTGEWEDIDVACPGMPEPYRSRIKAQQGHCCSAATERCW